MLKQVSLAGLFVIVGLCLGCAGRAANPIMVHQYGDEQKSCQAIEQEMAFIESEIQRLLPKTDKTGKNVALGITGFFLLVPLFFMDLSQAEQMEVDAYRQRYNHLLIVAGDKQCGFDKVEIPDPKKPMTPSQPSEGESK